jgi:hypothetical protein
MPRASGFEGRDCSKAQSQESLLILQAAPEACPASRIARHKLFRQVECSHLESRQRSSLRRVPDAQSQDGPRVYARTSETNFDLRNEPRSFARALGRGRLASARMAPAQSIELAVRQNLRRTSKCARTLRLSIVSTLPERTPSPEEVRSDRSLAIQPRSRATASSSGARHVIETGMKYPSPLSSSFTCPAPPVSTRNSTPTALQGRSLLPELLHYGTLPVCGRLNHLADFTGHRTPLRKPQTLPC